MIIGTAGHIDHGKTTLVRSLTGVDTDRLPQEKARGISIELGYAYTTTGTGASLGFIDVPGHERFVHTMLAGASGIDYAVLVVAADDGVMPQTREHLAILDLLGIRHCAIVITKADRVDAARVAQVRAAVARLIAPTAMRDARDFVVDARDPADAGLAALRAELERAAVSHTRSSASGLFRLCIDRAFTLAGHGTIITGTAEAGQIQVGQELTWQPAGERLRVRSLHAQNRAATSGHAGERLAINLAGIDASRLSRGDWLADAGAVSVTTRVDARLTLLPGAGPLGEYAPVHVHFSAKHATAHLLVLDAQAPQPGTPAWVQLVFDAPTAIAPGARFILRNAQASATIGGGLLIDPVAPARQRRTPARARRVAALEQALLSGELGELLAEAGWGYSHAALIRATGRPVPDPMPAGVRRVEAGGGDEHRFWIAERHWQEWRRRTLAALAQFHAERPGEAGPDLLRLRARVDARAPEALWRELIAALVDGQEVIRHGAWLQLPQHGAALGARDERDAATLLSKIQAARYDPPWARDLAQDTGLPEARVRELLGALGRAGRAYPIVADLYYEAGVVAKLAGIVAELARDEGGVDAAAFRTRIGIGRKRSIQILEFFDRVGYTRRLASGRVLRSGAGWGAGP